MQLSRAIVTRACERVFTRVCAIGSQLTPGTPAAGFVAAAARCVDEAQGLLASGRHAPDLTDVLALLTRVGALLEEVERLSPREVDGLERVSVIVDGLCVTLELDQRQAAQPGASAERGTADEQG